METKPILSAEYRALMPKVLGTPREGKARLIYEIPGSVSKEHPWGLLLLVAKDDVSTHNAVHQTPLPWKGYALTAFSVFGFSVLVGLPHHLVSHGKNIYPHLPNGEQYPEDLHLRSLVVEKLIIVPVEFVFREYLCGGLYKGPYLRGEDPYGIKLQTGLPLMSTLIGDEKFTPTAKSALDEPLDSPWVAERFPKEFKLASTAWEYCVEVANDRGFELVDGKLEIGWRLSRAENGRNQLVPVIGDEPPLTPDNVRLARPSNICCGKEPKWFGKENVRKWAEDEKERLGYDRSAPVSLVIPRETAIQRGQEDYYETFSTFTGYTLQEFWQAHGF